VSKAWRVRRFSRGWGGFSDPVCRCGAAQGRLRSVRRRPPTATGTCFCAWRAGRCSTHCSSCGTSCAWSLPTTGASRLRAVQRPTPQARRRASAPDDRGSRAPSATPRRHMCNPRTRVHRILAKRERMHAARVRDQFPSLQGSICTSAAGRSQTMMMSRPCCAGAR